MDVVPATILMYEQNKHPIPFDVANGLADVLDVNADLLYDDFAVFLSMPYSEAMSIGMSQRAFAEPIGSARDMPQRGLCKPPAWLVVMIAEKSRKVLQISGNMVEYTYRIYPGPKKGTRLGPVWKQRSVWNG